MKLKRLLATSVAAVAGVVVLVPLAACGDGDGYVDNTGETLTAVESSEAAEKLSAFITGTMQNSTNASLKVSAMVSGETTSYDVKLVKTDSHLYADETITSGDESVSSYVRDGAFYYYNMTSSDNNMGSYSYDTGYGYMIYDTIENMYYNFWSADLDELCTEEIMRAYYTDSSYEWYVGTYGEDYVKSMFKSTVTNGYTVYSSRMWTFRRMGSYTEFLKQFSELMSQDSVTNLSAEASDHRFEVTFNYGEASYSLSLTDGAALRTSDFASLNSLIDDEVCYISQSSASSLSKMANGGATLTVEGNGFLGSDLDEMYNGESGSMSIYASIFYAKYDGVIVPLSTYDPDMLYPMADAEENIEHAKDTGYLVLEKSYYSSYIVSSNIIDISDGTTKSFDLSIYADMDDLLSYSASSWLWAYGLVDGTPDADLFSLSSAEMGFWYLYTDNERTDSSYHNKSIHFYTYVSCDF